MDVHDVANVLRFLVFGLWFLVLLGGEPHKTQAVAGNPKTINLPAGGQAVNEKLWQGCQQLRIGYLVGAVKMSQRAGGAAV
jgi:hypothetical protein